MKPNQLELFVVKVVSENNSGERFVLAKNMADAVNNSGLSGTLVQVNKVGIGPAITEQAFRTIMDLG